MRDDKSIEQIISDALKDAPPAPERLRYNVMSAIREMKPHKRSRRRSVYALASAIAVLALAVGLYALGGDYLMARIAPSTAANENSIQMYSLGKDSAGGAVDEEAPPADSDAYDYTYDDAYDDPYDNSNVKSANSTDITEDISVEEEQASDAVPGIGETHATPKPEAAELPQEAPQPDNALLAEEYENALIVRGELPQELAGLETVRLAGGIYLFEAVTEETALELVEMGAEGEITVSGDGFVMVLWVPDAAEAETPE